jgi:hypothetical protein
MSEQKKKKREEEEDQEDDSNIGDISKELKSIEDDLQSFMKEDPLTEAQVEQELARIEKELAKEQLLREKEVQKKPNYELKHKKVTDDIREILPLWIEKPIYWITPGDKFEKRKNQWVKEWAQFLIAYTDTKHIFVVIVRDIRNDFPFKNAMVKKQLSQEQLVLIGDYLVEKNRAQWLDRKKTRLLVFWQTRDEMSEDLFLWAQKEGRQFLSIFDLSESDYWNSLPEEEVRKIFNILVREQKAIYVDSREKNSIRFEFKY